LREILRRYPTFTNPQSFIDECGQFVQNGNLTQSDNLRLKRYHLSILHKLTSAIYCHEKLKEIITERKYILGLTSSAETATTVDVAAPTTTTTTTITTPPSTLGPAIKPDEFDEQFQIAFYQDNLFSSLISSFDILSLKLNLIFSNPISNIRNCYFDSLANTLIQQNQTGTIQQHLDQIRTSQWFQETKPFRICLTHRQQPDFTVKIEVVAGSVEIKHILPDDPLLLPYTFNQQREIIGFCKDKVDNFVNEVNNIDGLLIREMNTVGCIPF